MKIKLLLLLVVVCIFAGSCKKQYTNELYAPPAGQQGHIYEQMAANPSLSIFVSAVDRVPGLKATLNSSGLFTIMAPTNDAFAKYFASQQYKSIDAIPINLLTQIINFHIIKYMLFQVNFLNPGITKMNYGQFEYGTQDIAVFNDKLSNGQVRSIYYPAKQMQVYTPYYFSNNAVTLADYQTVFGPTAHFAAETQLNPMGAAVTTKDIASGNGVIHIIDAVLLPPNNVAQELDTNPEYADYDALLKKRFLTYAYNQAATKAQGNNGDINGDGIVDSLWNRTYSINQYLDNENALASDKTTNINITAFVPTKAAFVNYLNTKFIPNFQTMDNVPASTLILLYNTHFTNSMDWPSKIDRGQEISVGGDNISVSRSDIVSVKSASNGLFYQVNKVLEPTAFTAVAGPAFFSPNYSYLAQMLTQTGLLPIISNSALRLTFLGATNAAFIAAGINFSTSNSTFTITTNGSTSNMGTAQLKALIGSNVLVGAFTKSNLTDGWYQTQSGSYVYVTGGKIQGADRTSQASIVNADISQSNGYFQGVDKLTLDPPQSIYDLVNASATPNPTPYSYMKFRELCSAVGILTKDFVSITSVDAGKRFTLFCPSNEVIIAAQVAGQLPKTGAQGTTVLDAAGKARLFSYLKYFFVQQSVFTDGKQTGVFPTSKTNSAGTAIPLTITYPGILTVTDNSGAQGRVNISNPNNYPQNVIAKDGVVQVIDNAFISQY